MAAAATVAAAAGITLASAMRGALPDSGSLSTKPTWSTKGLPGVKSCGGDCGHQVSGVDLAVEVDRDGLRLSIADGGCDTWNSEGLHRDELLARAAVHAVGPESETTIAWGRRRVVARISLRESRGGRSQLGCGNVRLNGCEYGRGRRAGRGGLGCGHGFGFGCGSGFGHRFGL